MRLLVAKRSKRSLLNQSVSNSDGGSVVKDDCMLLHTRKARTLLLCSLILILSVTNISKNSPHPRRILCERKLIKVRRNNEDTERTDFREAVRRFLETVNLYEDECETVYPAEVAVETAEDYYAAPEADSGIYYNEEAPIPTPELDGVAEGEVEPLLLNPDADEPQYYSNVETALFDVFEPATYEPVETTERPEDTTAYSVVITSCPETYNPPESEVTDPGAEIFEASAMLKQSVCDVTDTATTERRMQRRLRGLQENIADTSIANYTMYALVHPEAVNCPNPDGTMYNRVQLLQNQGYHVEIVGQPITDVDLAQKQPYIAEHIEEDVGVRDSMALHAFNLEEHNAVVLLDYNTQLQKPIQDEIDDLVLNPTKQTKVVKDKDGGISKGFMIIKPSKQKFTQYRNEYLNTPYDPINGWNNQGYNRSAGKMGLKGFFSYKSATDPSWEILDRCTYNNQLDDYCISQIDVDDSKVVRHSKSVCGNPRDCPYTIPSWSLQKKTACQKCHNNYMRARMQFEQRYLVKPRMQERIGRFKYSSFMGYCDGPGSRNYLGMTKKIKPKPSWATVCPPTKCGPGSFLKPDCTCTFPEEDPCNACPSGTRCQTLPELMCIDCNCGFCDNQGTSCCEFNDNNNCRSGPGISSDCTMQKDFFPSFSGTGNVCSGVEISSTAVPNGCGCKPNDNLPCAYNPDLQGAFDNKCFICTTKDLSEGTCPNCVDCLTKCNSCIEEVNSSDINAFKKCLDSMDDICRASCNNTCMK